jgi:hypothetical protein
MINRQSCSAIQRLAVGGSAGRSVPLVLLRVGLGAGSVGDIEHETGMIGDNAVESPAPLAA